MFVLFVMQVLQSSRKKFIIKSLNVAFYTLLFVLLNGIPSTFVLKKNSFMYSLNHIKNQQTQEKKHTHTHNIGYMLPKINRHYENNKKKKKLQIHTRIHKCT